MIKPATLLLSRCTAEDIPLISGDCIGVDRGAWFAYQHQLPMVHLLGDFDSISSEEKAILIKHYSHLMAEFSTQKDESDTALALQFAIDSGYQPITILGGFGGRSDHFYALTNLLLQYADVPIRLVHTKQVVQALIPGEYHLMPIHDYFSIFPNDDALISIQGAQYPLNKKAIQAGDTLGLSNTWVDHQPVRLIIHQGTVLLFLTND